MSTPIPIPPVLKAALQHPEHADVAMRSIAFIAAMGGGPDLLVNGGVVDGIAACIATNPARRAVKAPPDSARTPVPGRRSAQVGDRPRGDSPALEHVPHVDLRRGLLLCSGFSVRPAASDGELLRHVLGRHRPGPPPSHRRS
mmetsp:Transcript_54068/g.166349  ORF Transcript_54068/g.166349 Transcript_54068/m.166349 type:complete len:142 (-) Transcript_54068:208-633(-)